MDVFITRLKSFAWRFGAYLVIAGLAWIGDNIGLLELTPAVMTIVVPIIAFITGEITKWLNKNGNSAIGAV